MKKRGLEEQCVARAYSSYCGKSSKRVMLKNGSNIIAKRCYEPCGRMRRQAAMISRGVYLYFLGLGGRPLMQA